MMLSVAVGVVFTIELASVSGAGYVWTPSPLPASIVLVGQELTRGADHSLGGSAMQVFRFRALSPGHAVIGFGLKRAWETEPIDSKTVEVDAR